MNAPGEARGTRTRVRRALEDKQEKLVYVKGDTDAKYSAIMDAMDALRNGRIENTALITEPKEPALRNRSSDGLPDRSRPQERR